MGLVEAMQTVPDRFLLVDEDWAGQAPRYRHLATLQQLSNAHTTFGSDNLVELLFLACQTLWEATGHGERGDPSERNWRCIPQLMVQEDNPSPEVQLERLLAELGGDSWWNQVPVDCGLLGSRGRRAIDLVQRREGMRYSLFELKVAADTPLSAAMQILRYGVVFLCYRKFVVPLLQAQRSPIPCMMDAQKLDLVVLAPHAYYPDEHHDWLYALQSRLQNDLVESEVVRECGLTMSFRFEEFPVDFYWQAQMAQQPESHAAVREALRRRCSPFNSV